MEVESFLHDLQDAIEWMIQIVSCRVSPESHFPLTTVLHRVCEIPPVRNGGGGDNTGKGDDL